VEIRTPDEQRCTNRTTPIWTLIGLHMLLMLGLACLFTPSFTAGLNPLPP